MQISNFIKVSLLLNILHVFSAADVVVVEPTLTFTEKATKQFLFVSSATMDENTAKDKVGDKHSVLAIVDITGLTVKNNATTKTNQEAAGVKVSFSLVKSNTVFTKDNLGDLAKLTPVKIGDSDLASDAAVLTAADNSLTLTAKDVEFKGLNTINSDKVEVIKEIATLVIKNVTIVEATAEVKEVAADPSKNIEIIAAKAASPMKITIEENNAATLSVNGTISTFTLVVRDDKNGADYDKIMAGSAPAAAGTAAAKDGDWGMGAKIGLGLAIAAAVIIICAIIYFVMASKGKDL